MYFSADHIRQAALVTDYIASKREVKTQYLNTNFSLRLGIAGPPGREYIQKFIYKYIHIYMYMYVYIYI
jgi:hypothetical protein